MLKGMSRQSLCALPLLIVSLHAWAADTVTALYVQAPPGSLGDGETLTLSPSDGAFTMQTDEKTHLITVTINDDAHPWLFMFAPIKGQTLHTGTYSNIGWTAPSSTHATAFVAGDHESCSGLGTFDIRQLTLDEQGNVTALAVDFSHDCGGNGYALYGKLRVNSSVTLNYPSRMQASARRPHTQACRSIWTAPFPPAAAKPSHPTNGSRS